ncbi:MAG TPA: D-hexose-6-phosphate mutarotase [Draconibacterium sp.]|nr:D-hexose-6-phosphate mutarotase [Draconibacterium sp.]
MLDIDELDDKFSIEGEVGFAELEENMVFVTISNKFADADICLYGAHITNFKPHKTIEILWMSPESKYQEGKPIRGGIPICFPWFGPHKSDSAKPQHGFGRLMFWNVLETASLPTGETLVRLQLCSSEKTKSYWNHDFCAQLTVIVGKILTASLKVTNTSAVQFDYTCALHSYYNLSSVEEIWIEGLQNTRYFNQLDGGDYIQETPKLEIKQAETRHYYNTETDCIIHDPLFGRRIQVAKTGSKVTTVWNPGEETCSKIDDIPNDGFHTFVCIEAVNAFDDVITLAPGESHETSVLIGLAE